jgi:GNAT superfamily N-acetyltransferase
LIEHETSIWSGSRPRASHAGGSSAPMIARNGELVEPRLRQCSLYDPPLDLAVEDADGRVAGYALFWFDHTTLVGLLEPMRVEDDYRRRGLARMLLTTGLDRLARAGARRLKVGFETDAARNLYLCAGFVQTSIDPLPRRRLRADVYRSAAHSTSTARTVRAVTLLVRRMSPATRLRAGSAPALDATLRRRVQRQWRAGELYFPSTIP